MSDVLQGLSLTDFNEHAKDNADSAAEMVSLTEK